MTLIAALALGRLLRTAGGGSAESGSTASRPDRTIQKAKNASRTTDRKEAGIPHDKEGGFSIERFRQATANHVPKKRTAAIMPKPSRIQKKNGPTTKRSGIGNGARHYIILIT